MQHTGSWEIDKRPHSKDEMVLHPRILSAVKYTEQGIDRNYLFFGSFGNGKSTLSLAIMECYAKGNRMVLDASKTKPEDIRDKVTEFLGRARDGKSILIIDEINRLHKNGQEQLASSIEKSLNTNFILTSNTLSLEGALLNRFNANIVEFDLNKKELAEIKPLLFEKYRSLSTKPITDEVLEYLVKTYKECVRNGVQRLQSLNDTPNPTITIEVINQAESISPLLRAIFCSDSGTAIFKELEEFGTEKALTQIDTLVDAAHKLNLTEAAALICMETMEALGNLGHIYEKASRKVIIVGILLKINKILKPYPARIAYRNNVIAKMEDKKYYE